MKKFLVVLLALVFVTAAFSACAGEGISFTSTVDVDLTTLSSTMVYSEVYNMVNEPDNYEGKLVKMQGNFAVYEDELTGNVYYACLIADAAACCQQGVEFVPKEEYSYPDDFPREEEEIVVVGTFEKYYEGDRMYVHLVDSQFIDA